MANVERDLILEQYAYHHWASDRTLGAAGSLTVAQLDAEWGGSFGTGRALLRHVVGVEHLWCERWNGRSPKALPEFPATHGGREYLAEWRKFKADQAEYLSALTRDMLQGQLTYVNIKGDRFTYPLSGILLHVVNHGTYHRGQLTHLLRDRGLAAPSTDYLVFMEERRTE
jgi:uncharacterized damage-inducible protein DinB